jgi:PhzF family phenazine biosynthesis protein
MDQIIYQVDAFTDRPFQGNPAGVCLLRDEMPDDWMRDIAKEMNASETAFLHQGSESYDLRWFTPQVEVDLCGHATLAAAHILFETGELEQNETAQFDTRSGRLSASKSDGWIELDFPAEPSHPVDPPPDLLDALKVEALHVGENRFDYLVEVKDETLVQQLNPDFSMLKELENRGVIVTSPAKERAPHGEFDFVSRFFAPSVGIDEDPVTGSAHCCLGPYWQKKLGKDKMMARQISERGGVIRVHCVDDRVKLGGKAITVFSIMLHV